MITDEHAERLKTVAAELVTRMHRDDTDTITEWLGDQLPDPADWFRLACVLACAVPTNRPFGHQLEWVRSYVPRVIAERRAVLADALSPRERREAPKPYEDARIAVDEVAVHRAIDGDRTVSLTRAERSEAVRILTDRGLSRFEIAERLGVTDRTVVRWRAVHREESERAA